MRSRNANLDRDGFSLLPGSIEASVTQRWSDRLSKCLEPRQRGTLTSRGQVYGSRNLLQTWPRSRRLTRHLIVDAVTRVLGRRAGLVRILYFDKPPERSWSLPWHRDRTIAIERHVPGASEFHCPTTKAGIPHVEAPRWLLRQMLTLRIHLDEVTMSNGPMLVIPGSHCPESTVESSAPTVPMLCGVGEVLAMRPLLLHSSVDSKPRNRQRPRVLHLEFAAAAHLPHGMRWHTFIPSVRALEADAQMG